MDWRFGRSSPFLFFENSLSSSLILGRRTLISFVFSGPKLLHKEPLVLSFVYPIKPPGFISSLTHWAFYENCICSSPGLLADRSEG